MSSFNDTQAHRTILCRKQQRFHTVGTRYE